MAKDSQIQTVFDLSGFLSVSNEPGKEVMGMDIQVPGVLLRISEDTTDETGKVTGKNVTYAFKQGARLDPVCIDDKTTQANLVGGE